MGFLMLPTFLWIQLVTVLISTGETFTTDLPVQYLQTDDSLHVNETTILNTEDELLSLEDDGFNESLSSELDNNKATIRTLGVIESDESTSIEEVKKIMATFNKPNVTYSEVYLTDYSSDDAYSFKKAVKALRELNPNAVIGPYNWPYAVATEHLRIPYFVISQMPPDHKVSPFLVRLFPEPSVFAKAAEDILQYYKLDKVAVFYDCVAGEAILERLCGQPSMEVTGYFFNSNSTPSIREQLKIVRSKYYTTFISVLNAGNIHYLLEEGLSLSMFSSPYKWLLVNMNLQEYPLDKYIDSHANITVLRLLVDPTSNSCSIGSDYITMIRALFYDAVRLYAHINQADMVKLKSHTSVNMTRIIRGLEIDGCTGHFKFSGNATRSESFLQMITLEGYKKGSSGTWRSQPSELKKRVQPSKTFSSVFHLSENVFGDKPLRITIKEETPFVQMRTDNDISENNLDYEGFLIDILIEMSKLLDFSFTISKVPDGKYGSLKEEGWTGMIRQLVYNEADVALAPFQMTPDRAQVVDFTKPFMTKGTTVVVKRPEPKIGTFQFLFPFSNIVWCAIFVAFVSSSLMLFTVSRVNSDKQAKYTHNLRESFWYMWGTLLRGSLCGR